MNMEEPYRLVFEKNPLPMWVFDTETLEFLAVNDAALEHYGYSREEFISMTADRIRPAEEVPRFLADCKEKHEPHHKTGIWRHVKKDGTVIDVEVVVSDMPFRGRPARLVMSNDVSEQRRMEASRVESEARLRTYLEAAPEGIVVMDREGRIEFVNARMEEIFGYGRAELIGQSMDILLPERLRGQQIFCHIASVDGPRTGPAAMGTDLVGRRKDGSDVPIEAGLSSVPLKDGVAQIAFINDITVRKQAEAALRESEQRFRTLVETTSDMVWEIDENCVYTYVSPQVRTILGYTPEEVIGRTPFDLLDPEEARRTRDFLQEVAKGPEAFSCYESVTPDRSGHHVVIEVSGAPFFDENGVLRGYRGIARDITERKMADQALRESEASLGRAQQLAQIGNWETDMATGELHWSREVYRIFQIPAGEPLTRELFSSRVHPEDRAAVSKAVQVATETGAPYSIEHRIVLPDGTERYVREQAEVMHDERGTVRLVGTVQDITEYKRLEDQLRQAQRMEAVGRLAGGVAHDFNNLLTIIGGYGELLAGQLEPDSPQLKDLDEIIHAGERAAALTRQLLAFSRRQILQLKVMSLNTVVADLDKMLRRLIGEDVELVAALDGALGTVKADPTQIEQVIMNLAVNARDAMPMGGRLLIETRNVELDESYCRKHPEVQPGRYAMLAVTDSGAGMTGEIMSHIFEPFFTTKSREKGTGLGLSTVYGIIKQSGGSIFCYSEPGHGTTFKIYLPRVDEHSAGVRPVAAPPVPRGVETVLVVEDEAGVRTLIRTVLEASGYRVLEADRGGAALEILSQGGAPADLMVTDVVMPGMGGGELAEKARALVPGLRVLFISGYTDEAVVQHGVLQAGIPFLQKPFTHDALVSKIREVLDAGGAAPAR